MVSGGYGGAGVLSWRKVGWTARPFIAEARGLEIAFIRVSMASLRV
jgi:hypothetical protein